ncbi:MAG: tRNA (adenosine(37)-N6)-dimethylallyltransferase MiaA [Lachnospiraceae bacterium]|nr:tRNA (adenosine(37)-N6)-dimethylallyltransferase MiaA [Lachnospiraceae bacterium]
MESKQKLLILTGPTAVGKTDLSIKLAKKIGGEIISADSMQVYRKMDIGTAKISKDEMQGIPHYLIDCMEPDEEFNVTVFQKMAMNAIKVITANGHIPILTGGTAFYIQALLYGVDFTEEDHDDSFRNCLYEKAKTTQGKKQIYKMLMETDPEYAQSVHENNVRRVIRALEYHHFTGKKFSQYNENQRKRDAIYDFRYFVLTDERLHLYERIDSRVDSMMKQGLLQEVKSLYEMEYDRSLISMQGVGYKELFSYLDGKSSLEEAVEEIKKNTRHFAKRQMTWFRREKEVIFLAKNDFGYDDDKILDRILELTDWSIK